MASKNPVRFCVRANSFPTKLISVRESGKGELHIRDQRGPGAPTYSKPVVMKYHNDQHFTVHTSNNNFDTTIKHSFKTTEGDLFTRYSFIKNTKNYLCWPAYSRIVPYPIQKDRLFSGSPDFQYENLPRHLFLSPYNPNNFTLIYTVYVTRPSFIIIIPADKGPVCSFVEHSFRYFKVVILYHYVNVPPLLLGETLSYPTAASLQNGKEIDDIPMEEGTSILEEDLFPSYANMHFKLANLFSDKLERFNALPLPKAAMKDALNRWYGM